VSPCSSSCGCSPLGTTDTADSYWIAPPKAWEDAPESERRFRVTRFHHGDDGEFREAVIPLRSLKSQIENFARGDDLYGIWVDPL